MALPMPELVDEIPSERRDYGTDDDDIHSPPLTPSSGSGLRRRRNTARRLSGSSAETRRRRSIDEPRATRGDDAAPAAAPVAPASAAPQGGGGGGGMDALIGGALRSSRGSEAHVRAISDIDAKFRQFSKWVLCAYVALATVAYVAVPNENITRLDGAERGGAVAAMSLIAVSCASRALPLLGRGGKKNGSDGGGGGSRGGGSGGNSVSGIVVGGLTVQGIAFLTDFLLAFFPTPLAIDPVLGTRVHVLRWCEWCPCAAFMTFMVEGADMYWPGGTPPPNHARDKYVHALAQGGAVFLGFLFPFCPGPRSWALCMAGACGLYLTNFPRLRERRRAIPTSLGEGATVEEAERFHSARAALRLRHVTIVVWSMIVAGYFVTSALGPRFAREGSYLRAPAAGMICECFFDVLSKVMFLLIIVDVHCAIFDPFARMERRLDELRRLMAAVWESSSDVIAISVRANGGGGGGTASTMLSPSFFGLGSADGPLRNLSNEQIMDCFRRKSILYQLSDEAFQMDMETGSNEEEISGPKVKPEMITNIEETSFSTMDTHDRKLHFDRHVVEPESGPLRALSDIVVKAWACEERELVFSHDLRWASSIHDKDHVIRSEAKVSRLSENSLIVIVRDISERTLAFEAEKKIVIEATSRQKDAEANRFTRHEVKNGLLAAIGLYESLCDAQRSQLTTSQNRETDDVGIGFDPGNPNFSDDVVRCMNELGKSLHETLDTILIEAMTRDLIHDLYRPHREKIDLSSVLSGFSEDHSFDVSGVGNLTRFPLITRPSPLPVFHLDPNLLRYLHRQSLSNACKYGQTGGVVLTEILYDEIEKKMQINVINLPGRNHEKLIEMGPEAEEMVFAKGSQVHEAFQSDSISKASKKTEAAAVPGDGGWIIGKCAKIMKGDCSIKFEESRTVFSLSIPAKPYKTQQKIFVSMDVKTFSLPYNIWGIAIDDSKVQMKLLGKFFEFAGIKKERIKVFGQTADEIMGFVDYVVNFMDENMGDHVLLIADENLDVMDEASKHITISGSELVENIRSRLLPEYEAKLVALIRSANDSSSDIAIYNSRAHGFLPKAPIKKGNVLEALAPLWLARYPQQSGMDDDQSQRSRGDSMSSTESLGSSTSLNGFITSTPIEIIQSVREIDALFLKGTVVEDWNIIWEKLHILKGDLLTLHVGSKVISAVGMINSFRELRSNEELVVRWNLFRENISHWLYTSE